MTYLPPVSAPRLLLYTILSVVAFLLLTGAVVAALAAHYGVSLAESTAVYETMTQRQQLRFLLLVNNLGTWGLSAIGALGLAYRNYWPCAAGLVSVRRPELIGSSVLTCVFGLPAIGLAAYLNLQLDLPDWMVRTEDVGNAMLAGVLRIEVIPELLLALLTVAVVPAFCEEVMFRGLLQGRLLGKVMSGHAAVWVAAIIFSAIHVEFAGFLPRLLLGAGLGYAYRWTGTLWVPIVLHMLFNGVQVLTTWWSGEFTPDTELDTPFVPLLAAGLLSIAAVIYLGLRAERQLATVPPEARAL